MAWDLLIFAGAFGIAAVTPGPGLAAIVAATLASGARKTAWLCCGVILGDLVWLTLSLAGLAVIAQQIPAVFILIKWTGAIYLLHLALRAWRAPAVDAHVNEPVSAQSVTGRVAAGFAVTMGNPKAMLFYLALLPNLMRTETVSISLALLLAAIVVIVLGVVFTIYVLAANKVRVSLTDAHLLNRFNRATSLALGGAAAWIVTR